MDEELLDKQTQKGSLQRVEARTGSLREIDKQSKPGILQICYQMHWKSKLYMRPAEKTLMYHADINQTDLPVNQKAWHLFFFCVSEYWQNVT